MMNTDPLIQYNTSKSSVVRLIWQLFASLGETLLAHGTCMTGVESYEILLNAAAQAARKLGIPSRDAGIMFRNVVREYEKLGTNGQLDEFEMLPMQRPQKE